MTGFKKELIENILPFWIKKMQDKQNGGFYGRIDGTDILHSEANKGAILNARILWTFSSAYRILKNPEYLLMAQRAFDYINKFFIDKTYGGAYWELDYKGIPVNKKKQTYVQGFMLYGFSEFYRATGNEHALQLAKDFFYLIEKYHDNQNGGYIEAFKRDWQPIDDVRLSEKDRNEKKTMNTHLHILEPYTNLCRIWNDKQLIAAQKKIINIFKDKILNSASNHLNLFFDERWNVKSIAISYGHDIEASWLLFEAAEVVGDKQLLNDIIPVSLKIANAATEGLSENSGLIYEKNGKHIDKESHWWVQAEAVIGFMYAYKNTGETAYSETAIKIWEYIKKCIVDKKNGEWYWSRFADETVNKKDDKAGFWKCPYHNGRMCLEMIENFNLT